MALAIGRKGIPTLCIAKTATGEETARSIEAAGGTAEGRSLDLRDHQAAERAVSTWIGDHQYQRLGVVLAAAIVGPAGPLESTDLLAWAETFSVNLLGNLAVVRALLGRMLASRYGRIAFFAGGGAAYAYPWFPAYAASKAATVRVAEDLHEDLKDRGDFAVVCLAPGAVETDMLRQVRAAGADVRSPGPVDDAIAFIEAFLGGDATAISGRFIHARDSWADVLQGTSKLAEDQWKLRRIT